MHLTDTTGQLSLLAPAPRAAADDAVRLMLFNAQHAAPARSRRQVEWITRQDDADIVVLTEVSSTDGGAALITALTGHGYATVIAPLPEEADYRTVIACRTPHAVPVPSPVAVMPHRAPAARVTVGGHEIGILGLYVPSRGPRDRRNEAKRAFQESVTKALPALVPLFPGLPVVVAGDLNVIEPAHQPPHKVFGRWEYDFYDAFATAGLTDAYRHLHPDGTDHSWYSRTGTGFRFDHIFITTGHAGQVLACTYDHGALQAGLTDHAVMTFRLALAHRKEGT